jgi:hypothetical protein
MIYEFTIVSGDKEYKCEREVTGQRVFRQIIRVVAIGSKSDSASYGNKYHPASSMESVARLVAHEVIAEANKL